MIRTSILAGALLLSPTVRAQTTPPPPSASASDLALATDIAARTFPDGTYQRILGASMSSLMEGMVDQMSDLQLAPLLASSSMPPSSTAKLGRTTMRQVMDIIDPAYEKRMRIVMPSIMTQMATVMTRFEPQMRQGLAESYVHRFTGQQLTDIDRFMMTPNGAAFAAQSMTMTSDPAVASRMRNFVPTLVQSMPAMLKKAAAAAADLPKARTYAQLSAADRARLAQLLGSHQDATPSTVRTAAHRTATASGPNAPVTPPEDIAQHFGSINYPVEAIRSQSQGRVVADLDVDANGRVTGCVISSSSGSPALDATTCRIAVEQLSFGPATDPNGKATRGTYRLPVRWVLPSEPPALPPSPSPPPK